MKPYSNNQHLKLKTMAYQGQFYNFPTPNGMKLININNIAALEDINQHTVVTLNVKNNSGEFISFITTLSCGIVSGQIISMDRDQNQQ